MTVEGVGPIPHPLAHRHDPGPEVGPTEQRRGPRRASSWRPRGVVKTYGAVKALRGASLSVRPGEVHAPAGRQRRRQVHPRQGPHRRGHARCGAASWSSGQPRTVHSPAEARQTGLVSVYQEPALIPDLDVDLQPAPDRRPPVEAVHGLGRPSSAYSDLDRHAMVRDLPLAVTARPRPGPGTGHRARRAAPRRDDRCTARRPRRASPRGRGPPA